jgi:hemoglobin-like flavoprotein
MTQEQIALVRKSFDRLRPLPRGAGKDFFETLFALDPSLKPLFSTDVENQGAMFVVALGLALKGLDDDGVVDESLRELGRRHVLYGAKDIHLTRSARRSCACSRSASGSTSRPRWPRPGASPSTGSAP